MKTGKLEPLDVVNLQGGSLTYQITGAPHTHSGYMTSISVSGGVTGDGTSGNPLSLSAFSSANSGYMPTISGSALNWITSGTFATSGHTHDYVDSVTGASGISGGANSGAATLSLYTDSVTTSADVSKVYVRKTGDTTYGWASPGDLGISVGGGGTITSVTGTAPISASGDTAVTISLTDAIGVTPTLDGIYAKTASTYGWVAPSAVGGNTITAFTTADLTISNSGTVTGNVVKFSVDDFDLVTPQVGDAPSIKLKKKIGEYFGDIYGFINQAASKTLYLYIYNRHDAVEVTTPTTYCYYDYYDNDDINQTGTMSYTDASGPAQGHSNPDFNISVAENNYSVILRLISFDYNISIFLEDDPIGLTPLIILHGNDTTLNMKNKTFNLRYYGQKQTSTFQIRTGIGENITPYLQYDNNGNIIRDNNGNPIYGSPFGVCSNLPTTKYGGSYAYTTPNPAGQIDNSLITLRSGLTGYKQHLHNYYKAGEPTPYIDLLNLNVETFSMSFNIMCIPIIQTYGGTYPDDRGLRWGYYMNNSSIFPSDSDPYTNIANAPINSTIAK